MTTEAQLNRIEGKIDQLLQIQAPVWISGLEAMKRLNRSKVWLRRQRPGVVLIPADLIEGTDWRYINGRTPEYSATSIERRKNICSSQAI
jgi:hypothetical protein